MANFPASVYSPSAVSNGQTIDAARDNGQDAEITAIESGYLQGTAPLNSSNSTVANLVVTGALQVSGGSTFAVRPVCPPPDIAQVTLQSTVTIGSSVLSTLAWTTDQYVSNSSMHSTGVNPERLIPQTTGFYRVTANVVTGLFASTGAVALAIRDSSANNIGNVQYGASSQVHIVTSVGYKRVDALGTYFVVVYGQTGQSTMSLLSGIVNTWAVMEKL